MRNTVYIFFGLSHIKGKNLNSIKKINIDKNDKFEIIYVNEQITLSSLSSVLYYSEYDHGLENEDILLLGGFDGNKYIGNSLVFITKDSYELLSEVQ